MDNMEMKKQALQNAKNKKAIDQLIAQQKYKSMSTRQEI